MLSPATEGVAATASSLAGARPRLCPPKLAEGFGVRPSGKTPREDPGADGRPGVPRVSIDICTRIIYGARLAGSARGRALWFIGVTPLTVAIPTVGNGRGEPSGPSPALLGTRRYIQAHALLGILPQAPDVRRQRPPYSARASAPLTLLVPRCLPVQRLVVRSGPALDFVYVRLVARGFNVVRKLRALFGQGVRDLVAGFPSVCADMSNLDIVVAPLSKEAAVCASKSCRELPVALSYLGQSKLACGDVYRVRGIDSRRESC